MNNTIVDVTGGLRLDTGILDFAFEAPKITQLLGYLAHDLAIINGCTENNNVVNSGTVFINGEILPFKQSVKGNTVVIVEKKTKRAFKTGQNKDVLIERWVEFGISTQSYNWASFYRVKSLKQLESELAQKAELEAFNTLITRVEKLELFARPFAQGGSMLFWNKPADQIPEGWREVVNWRERIPMGYNPDEEQFSAIGDVKGAKQVTLALANLPPHTHKFKKPTLSNSFGPRGGPEGYYVNQTEGESYTESVGGGEAFSILPPVKIVMYIEPIPTP
ncbi:hypothetical protein HX001_00165 [Empedobacter brevis]|uniref:Uncharacterized protein n=1 Tax=Empedobacter brevis TaxID=247 RepID=A0AAJ1QB95_9FLAO|nr:hypothetical protein [Empedobacter brevis]MDM1070899.1 hypothetical protein [Empedobacter brevis]